MQSIANPFCRDDIEAQAATNNFFKPPTMTKTFKEAHKDFFEPFYNAGIRNAPARLKEYALYLKADTTETGFGSLSEGKKRIDELTTDKEVEKYYENKFVYPV